MIAFLKKFLLKEWWIPSLLFFIAIVLVITKKSIFLLLFSALILFASSIWQFFKGRILIGILQILILITPILLFVFMLYIFYPMIDKPDSKIPTENISDLIKEKTDFALPNDFKVIKNLVHHTEGAFDSDYSINLILEYKNPNENNITKQIVPKIDTLLNKGIWKYNKNGFNFIQIDDQKNKSEPFDFEIDTIKNRIDFNLMHL